MVVELKINIIGPMGTGKTSIFNQYVHKKFSDDCQATLGAHIQQRTVKLDNETLKMQLMDVSGQELFRPLLSTLYKPSDGCLLVFDVTDNETFLRLESWRKEFMANVQSPATDFPIIVLGNKIDLEDRKVSQEVAHSWCEERNILYFEVSAKDNININLAFETLIREALMHYHEYKERYLTDSFKLTSTEEEEEDKPRRKGCC